MSFGGAWNLWRNAATGAVTASSSDSVVAFGCTLTRAMSISSTGALSGSLKGKFSRDFTVTPSGFWVPDLSGCHMEYPAPYTKAVDFGDVRLWWDSGRKRFTGRLDKDGFSFDFAWP